MENVLFIATLLTETSKQSSKYKVNLWFVLHYSNNFCLHFSLLFTLTSWRLATGRKSEFIFIHGTLLYRFASVFKTWKIVFVGDETILYYIMVAQVYFIISIIPLGDANSAYRFVGVRKTYFSVRISILHCIPVSS